MYVSVYLSVYVSEDHQMEDKESCGSSESQIVFVRIVVGMWMLVCIRVYRY